MPRVVKVCAACGSDDISVEAAAAWDVGLQKWVLSRLRLGIAHCRGCGSYHAKVTEREAANG